MANKKVAIMQPYIFPYLSYFQLVSIVDVFIFYDDVSFIKGGWINRNNILLNNSQHLLSFPCDGISSNKKINQIGVNTKTLAFKKILKTIKNAYSKAPFFHDVFPLVEKIINTDTDTIANLASASVIEISNFLDLKTDFSYSSVDYPNTSHLNKTDRVIAICKKANCSQYINPIGGIQLYDKNEFAQKGCSIKFIKTRFREYKQFNSSFIPMLSIIDILMFNDKYSTLQLLSEFELV